MRTNRQLIARVPFGRKQCIVSDGRFTVTNVRHRGGNLNLRGSAFSLLESAAVLNPMTGNAALKTHSRYKLRCDSEGQLCDSWAEISRQLDSSGSIRNGHTRAGHGRPVSSSPMREPNRQFDCCPHMYLPQVPTQEPYVAASIYSQIDSSHSGALTSGCC